MRKRKRIGAKPIDLSHIQVEQPKYVDECDSDDDYEYDPEEEYRNPERKRIIPDGEQAFFSAIKNGEDW